MPTKSATAKATGNLAPARLPKRLAPAVLESLDEQAIYKDLLIVECELSDQQAEYVTFETTQLKNTILQRAALRMLRLADVRFESCDLAEAIWERVSASRVELIGCRLIGLQATGGRIEDLLMRGCNASHIQLWGNLFKGAHFESCNLSEANFQSADLTGAVFDKCDLRGARFGDAKLAGADLRTSEIDGARAGLKELQGAIVNAAQAISIARALGVDVRME